MVLSMTQVKKIPDGYHSITPYLNVKDGARAIDFYKKAFGAKELMRMMTPDGKALAHGNPDQRYVLCIVFCIRWGLNEYYPYTELYYIRNSFYNVIHFGKICISLPVKQISRL